MEHWTGSDHDQSIGGEDCTFSNQEDAAWDLAKAIHIWSPMEEED